jgi:alkylated DNA repair dioxygenase AlkB
MTGQAELFPEIAPSVPGLTFVPEAVAPAREREIAEHIDTAPLEPFRFGQWRGKRLTCSYGSGYDYQRGSLAKAPPLPDWLQALRDDLAPLAGLDAAAIRQALVIRYDPGAGIGWHRDRPQYDEVLGLSLSAPCVLRLRRRTATGFERRSVELPPRSLYVLRGDVREEWEHSIVPMDVTRRSVTMRTLR